MSFLQSLEPPAVLELSKAKKDLSKNKGSLVELDIVSGRSYRRLFF